MSEIRTAYRIVEMKGGHPHTLFHGMEDYTGAKSDKWKRSRKIQVNAWIKAEKKMVRDGTGPWYLSGFNVLLSREDCEKYLSRFTAPRELRVVEILVRGELRKKEHSPSSVMLADEMQLEWGK